MRKLFHYGLAGYKLRYVKSDFVAAVVVTAVAVPQSLGFAVIAGLPPETGLYTSLVAPIVYGLIAHSRRLIVGADSATAALVASGALLVAQAGTAQYANAVAVLGLLVAAILFAVALLRMSFLADLISRPVIVGFLGGVGVQLILGKLPDMLGLMATGSLWQHVVYTFSHLDLMNGMTATVSLLVVGVVVLMRKTKLPGELIGLILAVVFAVVFNIDEYGSKLVGALPDGLPALTHPSLTLGMVTTLFPAALSIALVILAQSSVIIRQHASEHDEKVHLNQDLFALGVSNAASALTHGFSVNGSPPRSLIAEMSGGRSALTNVFMGGLVALLLLFGGQLFVNMPVAALSSIVFVLGWKLLRFQEISYLWKTHKDEFVVAMIALVGTALFGVYQGVIIAVIVSLIERLRRQYHPHDEILLRDGKLSDWAAERAGEHRRHDTHPAGLLIYKFDGSLFFENVQYFVSRLKRAINGAKTPVTRVIIEAGAIDSIDYTAVETVKTLYRQLSVDNIQIGFAHVSPNLRRQFDAYGMTNLVGSDNIYTTLWGSIKDHPGNKMTASDMVKRLHIDKGKYVAIGGVVLEALDLRQAKDVDLVVSEEVYARFRDKEHWREYVQDNGKQLLSRDGYNLMHTWMGHDLQSLQRGSFEIDGVTFMNVDELIETKRRLGRRKDIEDVEMLETYKKQSSD